MELELNASTLCGRGTVPSMCQYSIGDPSDVLNGGINMLNKSLVHLCVLICQISIDSSFLTIITLQKTFLICSARN